MELYYCLIDFNGTCEILFTNVRLDRGKSAGLFSFRNVSWADFNAVSMAVADNVRIGKKKDQKTGEQDWYTRNVYAAHARCLCIMSLGVILA